MTDPIIRNAGRRLRELRELNGVTQKGLATYLGVSFQQIQKYESGVNRFGATVMWQAAKLFGVTPLAFFEGLDDKTPPPEPSPQGARQRLDMMTAFNQVPAQHRRAAITYARTLAEAEKARAV